MEKMEHNAQALTEYDAMTTQELGALLRRDADDPGETGDMEALLQIMEVLAERKKAADPGKSPEQAWEELQRYYLADETLPQKRKPKKLPCKQITTMLCRVAAVAAAVALMVILKWMPSSATADGGNQDVDVVPVWEDGAFTFQLAEPLGFAESMYEDYWDPSNSMLDVYARELTNPVGLPNWMPERLQFDTAKLNVDMGINYYDILYKGDDETVYYVSRFLYEPETTYIYGHENSMEVYVHNGTKYYIFSNYGYRSATWIDGKYQHCVSGKFTRPEMIKIIDSIQEG